MGEGERAKRTKQFKHREDQVAVAEMQAEDLISQRAAETMVQLECELLRGVNPPSLDKRVLLLDLKKDKVSVFVGQTQIGWVAASGTRVLREQLNIGNTRSRSLHATVTEVSELARRFFVEI
jgi:hypothetical protein